MCLNWFSYALWGMKEVRVKRLLPVSFHFYDLLARQKYGDEGQISGYLGLELEFGFGYKEAARGNFFKAEVNCSVAFPSGLAVKNLPAVQEMWVRSLVRKIPWRRSWLPTPVFLPAEVHGQRSYKESDTTEVTAHEHNYSVFQSWW